MSRETFIANSQTYVVSPDEPVPLEFRWRAFLAGQARDAVTRLPLTVPVRVTVDLPGFQTQVKDDNWFVIYGRARECVPQLATQSYSVQLRLEVDGYLAKTVARSIPQTPAGSLPDLITLSDVENAMQRA